jgi:filamentous hemagglutinin
VTSGGYFQFGRWYPTATPCHINANDLIIELSDRNVRIDTANAGFAEQGDVIIATTIPVDNLPTNVARTLTVNAQRNITINGAFSQAVAGGDNTPNPLSLVLNGGGTGTVSISNSVSTSGGGITISSVALTIANAIPVLTGGGALSASLSGSLSLGTAYLDTDGAGISITAAGSGSSSAGMFTDGGALSLTTTGNLTVSGTMDARLGANAGSVLIRSTTGTLPLSSPSQARAGSAGTATIRAFQKLSIAGPVSGGAVWAEAESAIHDTEVTSTGSLTSTAGGITVRAGNFVTLLGAASANGPLEVVADTNAGILGDAIVGAALSTQGQPIVVSGHSVSMSGVELNSNGGNVTLTALSGSLSHSGSIATQGGNLQISGNTFTLHGAITTSGGSATFQGLASGAINNDVTSSGGNITASVSGVGATLSKSAGSDLDASGGAGTSKVSVLVPAGSVGPWAGRVDAGSGGIEITASGALTLKDEVSSSSGPVNVTLSGVGALLTLEGSVRSNSGGSVNLKSTAGGVLAKPLAILASGTTGGLLLEAGGTFDDVTVQGSLTGGSGGVTLKSNDSVWLQSALNTPGPITIAADTNAGIAGDAQIAAAITASSGPLHISGQQVAVTASLATLGTNLKLSGLGGVAISGGTISTSGGDLHVSGQDFSLHSATTTSGGNLTMVVTNTASIQNDISTSGGNATVTMTGIGASINAIAGSNLDASGGAGTSRVSIMVPSGSFGPWPSAITSGSGGVEIAAAGSSTLAGQIMATSGPVDVTLTGTGAVLRVENQVSATYTGSANVTLRSLAGSLQLASTANLQGANTVTLHGQQGVALDGDIPTAGSVDVDCGAGNIAIGATSAISNSGPLIAFDAANSTITVAAGASITPGPNAKLHFQTGGGNSLLLSIPLGSGSGGIELMADHNVEFTAPLTTSGPVNLQANADSVGAGSLNTAAIFADSQPVTLRGNGITVGGLVNTSTGEIRMQPAAGTTANVPASLDGPTRLVSGTTRFTGGTVVGGSLTVNDGAVLEFDGPSRTLSPVGFVQNGPQGETHLRIGGTGAGQFNRILSSGSFASGGKLTLLFDPGYVPAAGHTFQVFQFTSYSGAFANMTLPALGSGLAWDTSRLSVDGIIRILTSIQAWRQQYFGTTIGTGDAADLADPDSDDVVNLLEYAFGMIPTEASRHGLPEHGTVELNGQRYLTLALKRPLSVTDLSYRFRAGSNLPAQGIGSLYSYLGDVPNNAVTTEVLRETIGDGMERIVVRDNVAIGDAPARFMQVQVTSQ